MLSVQEVEALEQKVARMNVAADALRWNAARDENTPAEASVFRRDLREGYAALANAAPKLLAAALWVARNNSVYDQLSAALDGGPATAPADGDNGG